MLGKTRGKTRKVKSAKTTTSHSSEDSNEDHEDSSGVSVKLRYSTIPKKVGNEVSFTHFAAPIEPPLIQDLLTCKLPTLDWLFTGIVLTLDKS